MIADETVGITEEEIMPFLQEKGHPALSMDPSSVNRRYDRVSRDIQSASHDMPGQTDDE